MLCVLYVIVEKENIRIKSNSKRPKGGPKTALSFNPPGHMHIFILWPWTLCTTCRAARPRPLCFVQRNGTAARHGHLRRILDFYRFCWCWSTQSRTLRYDRYGFVLFCSTRGDASAYPDRSTGLSNTDSVPGWTDRHMDQDNSIEGQSKTVFTRWEKAGLPPLKRRKLDFKKIYWSESVYWSGSAACSNGTCLFWGDRSPTY